MKHAVIGEAKEHYKAYKAGKQWIYACITVVAVGLGLAGANMSTAQAATIPDAEPAASQVVQTPTAEKPAENVTTSEKQNEEPAGDQPAAQEPANKDNVKDESDSNKAEKPANPDVKNDVKDVEKTVEQSGPEKSAGEQEVKTPGTTVTDQTTTEPAKQVDKKSDQKTNVAPIQVDPVAPKPVIAPQGRIMMARAAVAPIYNGPKNLTAVPVFRAPDFNNILGKDASEWMPDANLRTLLITSIDQQYYGAQGIVNSANLYQYAGFDGDWMKYGVNTLEEYSNPAPIKNLEGLQYFTNLRTFKLSNAELPLDSMIDFSFAPNLRSFELFNADNVKTDWGVSADTVLQTYLANNPQLQYLTLSDLNLNGGFPDLTAYPELYMVNLSDNQMTGNLPDISYLQNVWELNVNSNQLSGQLPDVSNWSVTSLRVSNNKFTGVLPNTSTLTSLEYTTNEIGTGIIPGSYRPGAFVVGYGQTLTNTHHVLTNGNNSFDPTEGTFTNFMNFTTGETVDSIKMVPGKFSNGALAVYSVDSTDGIVNHNEWAQGQTDASAWFTVKADPNNANGFLLVANKAAKNGNYVIKVVLDGSNGSDYSAWVNFSVTNNMTNTVTPVTPNTPDPDAKTGTLTIISVDENGTIIGNDVKTGNIGDTFNVDAPSITGYKVTGNANATGTYTADGQTITFTYTSDGTLKSGGDGATIDDTTPADKATSKVTKGGAADTLTGPKQGTKQAQQVASQKQAPVTTLKASGQAATVTPAATPATDKQADKTVLPQTNEATGNYVLAGIATLIGALGLAGLKLRKRG